MNSKHSPRKPETGPFGPAMRELQILNAIAHTSLKAVCAELQIDYHKCYVAFSRDTRRGDGARMRTAVMRHLRKKVSVTYGEEKNP